ncbi:MAP kinase-interacting serine/threonine-protein kinase 1-like [Aplysia californica]|uniref:MAP kinase-interacting serine/threonine-protein kinase 1-like n=1 Tax=Aplysia californica TaxID=6500 RepID=A0ABM1A8M7_APLCA|nr:MAP kinase-interacting serine/threonine-protein kinase 1-like [Aplysia californica]
MLPGSGSSPVMESLVLGQRQLEDSAEQSKDSGSYSGDSVFSSSNQDKASSSDSVFSSSNTDKASSSDSVFCSSNPDTRCNASVFHTSNADIASKEIERSTTKTDKDITSTGTAPSDSRKRKRPQNHGDCKRRITPEAGTGAVFPAPYTDVASCDVMSPTATTNNTGVGCARNKVFPTDSKKRKRRQRKERTNGDIFCPLFEPTGEKLGQGCFGSVSTYRNKESGKEYAVKVMRNCREKRLRRVLSEIEICRRYKNCENILNFVDFYRTGDTFFLMFDKMAGGDLRAMLSSTPYLSESQASRVTGAVARALHTLHRDGVAHRDLKPNNILCLTPGEVTPLALCDFGVASEPPSRRNPSKDDIPKPALKSAVGCPQYLAPEVAGLLLPTSQRRTAPYDTRCDMWSFGILIYEMLFGCQPFVGHCAQHAQTTVRNCRDCFQDMFPKICSGNYSIPTNTRESLSDTAVDLIRNLLVVDPQDRYSAAEVLKHPFVTAHRDDAVTRTDCLTVLP